MKKIKSSRNQKNSLKVLALFLIVALFGGFIVYRSMAAGETYMYKAGSFGGLSGFYRSGNTAYVNTSAAGKSVYALEVRQNSAIGGRLPTGRWEICIWARNVSWGQLTLKTNPNSPWSIGPINGSISVNNFNGNICTTSDGSSAGRDWKAFTNRDGVFQINAIQLKKL